MNKCNVIFSFSQQGSVDFRAAFHSSVLYVKLHNELSRIFTCTSAKQQKREEQGSRISLHVYETKKRLKLSYDLGNTGQRFYLFLQRHADHRHFDDS